MRLVQWAIYLLLFGGVVFFGLTRTKVGRSELREQVEAQFNARFAGSLHIGSLEGNLINDLYASEVQIRDPDGRILATVDSVVARPRWTSLAGGTLSIRSITLLQPRLVLRREADATWNARATFQRTDPSSSRERSIDITVADVRIESGEVRTINPHPRPKSVRTNWLFDYTNASVQQLQGNATLEWTDEQRLLETYDLSLRLPDADLQVIGLQAQAVQTGEGWRVNQLSVRTPGSRIDGSAAVATGGDEPPRLDVDLSPSQIDQSELQRVVPRLPLAGTVGVEGRVRGPLSRLVVDNLSLSHGSSSVSASGTILGLPDSVDVETRVDDSRIRVADVRSVWPEAPIDRYAAVEEVRLDGFLAGTASWEQSARPVFDVESTLDAASPVGAVAGSLRVRRPAGKSLTYRADLRTDSLDIGTVFQQPALTSRMNGRVSVSGRGLPRRSSLAGTARLRFGPSVLAGQRLDTLSVDLDAAGQSVEAVVDVRQTEGGRFRGRGRFDASRSIPSYRFALASLDFDLGQWPVDLPRTRLNGVATVQGRGVTWNDLAGTLSVRVDTSQILREDSTTTLPPHWSTLQLADPDGAEPRIRLYGSLGSAQVEGDVPLPALVDLGRLWSRAFRDAIGREFDKPYASRRGDAPSSAAIRTGSASAAPPAGPLLQPTDLQPAAVEAADMQRDGSPSLRPLAPALRPEPDPASISALREQARSALRTYGFTEPLQFRADLQVDQPEIIRAWIPTLPQLTGPIRMDSRVAVDPDTLSLDGTVDAERMTAGATGLGGLHLSLRSTASLRAPLARTLESRLTLGADSLQRGQRVLAAPTLEAHYGDGSGTLRWTAGSPPNSGDPPPEPDGAAADEPDEPAPYRLRLGLDLQPDRNVLTVQEIYARTARGTWQTARPGRIDLFSDAAVIESFALESPRPSTDGVQHLRVHGTLSRAEADSVFIDASNVLLHPLFAAAGTRRPIGGLANGTVVVTDGLQQPNINSSVQIDRLSFDRRLLGRLQVSTRYRAGSPALELAARLRPQPQPADSLADETPALVPRGVQATERNRLTLTGSIRLPTALRTAPDPSPGTAPTDEPDIPPSDSPLNLQLDVERADLFFFEYVFEEQIQNVRGYTAGTAQITGSWTDPTFNAEMIVRDGAFSLPDFGLRYRIDGDVDVDREGFHLRDVVVSDGDGRADISGDILFNEYRYFSFDLRGELDEIQIIDVAESRELPFYGDIRASATASLTGPLYNARLSTDAARTTPDSELFIPVSDEDVSADSGFIIFADSTGRLPNIRDLTRRDNVLSDRPAGEPTFIDGLEIDINVIAPEGSTVNLVFDPLIGDVVTAVGSGRVQLQQQEGEFLTYGQFNVTGGDYLFTAGEVFVRRFTIDSGTLTWDGDPINAQLDIDAAYRTRASTRGLPSETESTGRIPVVINLDITGRVETPQVDLSLALARDERGQLVGTQTLDAILNQPDATTEYATSVLLTNTFLLTTSSASQPAGESGGSNRLATAGNQLAFNSVSQLVASQLNRYLSAALPNVDVNFGLQGEDPEDLDVIYGVALRLLDERLIIRGEGVYTGDDPDDPQTAASLGPQGEFVVEVRLSRRVSAEVFFRRQGDDLAREALTQTAGVGLSYQSEFSTWKELYNRLFGWLRSDGDEAPPDTTDDALAERPPPPAPSEPDDADDGPPPTNPPLKPQETDSGADSTDAGGRP